MARPAMHFPPPASRDADHDASVLPERLFETRELSLRLAAPLSAEDMTAQAMDDASPTKWHLAHTSWFFETFVLKRFLEGYEPYDAAFDYCFNSYYDAKGARQPRPKRGLLTRPSLRRVRDYRRHVDLALERLVSRGVPVGGEAARLLELGVNHEQQHQELTLTDILALFAANPLRPAYRAERSEPEAARPRPLRWIAFPGGVRRIGADGRAFAYDNETPRHDALVYPFAIADRLVANAEWLEFIADGGYETPSLWLFDGWAVVLEEGWRAPLYWERRDGEWMQMTLDGLRPLLPQAPVSHVSFYEADAFARWAGKRLPTEFEWEIAASPEPVAGNLLPSGALRPLPPSGDRSGRPRQMFGDVWEWTQSAYLPYPGYRRPQGALGEYNGKFMSDQHVLRGGSCATPAGHVRPTYRNFFYAHQRWQFTGLRLAAEID